MRWKGKKETRRDRRGSKDQWQIKIMDSGGKDEESSRLLRRAETSVGCQGSASTELGHTAIHSAILTSPCMCNPSLHSVPFGIPSGPGRSRVNVICIHPILF